MDTNAVLDKVAKGIEAAEPKVEEAIRKTLGEDAAKKFHDIAEKAEKALEDPETRAKIGDAANKAAAQLKTVTDKVGLPGAKPT